MDVRGLCRASDYAAWPQNGRDIRGF
jgi:hypothetical protein